MALILGPLCLVGATAAGCGQKKATVTSTAPGVGSSTGPQVRGGMPKQGQQAGGGAVTRSIDPPQ